MKYWLQITSGRGPEECCWVVAQLLKIITQNGEKNSIELNLLETVKGRKKGTLKSAFLSVEGENAELFIKEWAGTIKWSGSSMFRPGHKRKNWFAGVNSLTLSDSMVWSEKEFRFEKMRSSGPGGQHANKTESAVRVTHVVTGLSAFAQEERSQHLNKKLAMARLNRILEERNEEEKKKSEKKIWHNHNTLERGNPVKCFKGLSFKEV